MEPARIARVIKSQLIRRLSGDEEYDLIRHPAAHTYKWNLQKGGLPPTVTLEVSDLQENEGETTFTLRVLEHDGGENQGVRLDGVVSALIAWPGCTIRHPDHFAGGFTMPVSIRTEVLIPLLLKLK